MPAEPALRRGGRGVVVGAEADLDTRIEEYRVRVDGQKTYYERKANYYKRRYTFFRILSTVSAVLIPVVTGASLPVLVLAGITTDLGRLASAALGLIVALTVSLEGVLHYRELWQNYRTTEQYLDSQIVLFGNLVDPYAGLAPEEAFRRFIERIEAAIRNENEVTLNVLTRVEPTPQTPRPGPT
jgi:hypothetical protein